MSPRDHHVAGQPPAWSRRAHGFRRLDGTLVDAYMRDEERRDEARDAADWRKTHPGRPGALRRRWIFWRAVRRQPREFRRAGQHHAWLDRLAELGHKLMESWWVLAPLGLMCAWAVLYRAGVFSP